MSSVVFPSRTTLPGVAWPVKRTPMWKTIKPVAISGKESAIALWSYPRYQYELVYNVLRTGSIAGSTYTEWQTLLGFYNARNGGFDSFLFDDEDDDSVTTQNIGTGDGTTTAFQLVRSLGGFAEPVLAPNVVTTVYDNGTPVNPLNYTVNNWAATNPGVLAFTSAPAAGHTITATFTYYWPCRFVEDSCEFEKMLSGRYAVKKLTFMTIK